MHEDDGVEEHEVLHDEHVALADGDEHGIAEPRRAEGALDRYGPGKDEAEQDARQGDHREQGVGKRVQGDDERPFRPLARAVRT